MPWNPYTGMFEMATAPGAQRYTGPAANASLPGATPAVGYGTGNRSRLSQRADLSSARYLGQSLLPQERGREAAAARDAAAYRGALADPAGVSQMYADLYQKAGEAIAAPALRDYQQTAARTGANVAARFGGNVSSEELRQGYNTGDLFTRNLSEAMARLGGEQVAAGQRYTSELGSAAAQSAAERDRLQQAILQAIGLQPQKQPKKSLGDYVGGVLGGLASNVGVSVGI